MTCAYHGRTDKSGGCPECAEFLKMKDPTDPYRDLMMWEEIGLVNEVLGQAQYVPDKFLIRLRDLVGNEINRRREAGRCFAHVIDNGQLRCDHCCMVWDEIGDKPCELKEERK